jgi:hypothetical protein
VRASLAGICLILGVVTGCGASTTATTATSGSPAVSPTAASAAVTTASAAATTGAASGTTARTAATTTPATKAAGGGNGDYCGFLTGTALSKRFDDLLSMKDGPDQIKASMAALHDLYTGAASRAPADLKPDYAEVIASSDRYSAILAKVNWDTNEMAKQLSDPLSPTAIAFEKIGGDTADKAAERIDAYNEKTCGLKG